MHCPCRCDTDDNFFYVPSAPAGARSLHQIIAQLFDGGRKCTYLTYCNLYSGEMQSSTKCNRLKIVLLLVKINCPRCMHCIKNAFAQVSTVLTKLSYNRVLQVWLPQLLQPSSREFCESLIYIPKPPQTSECADLPFDDSSHDSWFILFPSLDREMQNTLRHLTCKIRGHT